LQLVEERTSRINDGRTTQLKKKCGTKFSIVKLKGMRFAFQKRHETPTGMIALVALEA
jgi:hypothetical protein